MTAITTNITATANTHRAGNFFAAISNMVATRKQRNALKNLTEAQLADIGVTRVEAAEEAARSFWDAPANWTHKKSF